MAFTKALGPLVNGVPSDCGIWVGDLKTGRVRQLTSHTKPPCDPYEGSIDWCPYGKRLVYDRDIPLPSGKVTTAIYTMEVDGTSGRRLTDPDLVAAEPEYSPDGRWIVFCTYPLDDTIEGDSQLYRMHADGSDIEQLTHFEDVRATQPNYSPHGDWIIFSAAVPGAIDLWAIPAAGGAPVVISDLDTARTHGAWQPS
jgi:Tol biopolymer transport system component